MKSEYVCEKCGTKVYAAIPVPGETIWCAECRFVEGIDDPSSKAQMEEFLARKNASEEGRS